MKPGRVKRLCCLALCLLALTACGRNRGESASIFAMDTVMELTAYGDNAQEALDAATEEIERLDDLLSAQKEGSEVWDINHGQWGLQDMNVTEAEVSRLIKSAFQLSDETEGALDITIYPAMKAWGFYDKNYRVPSEEELETLRTLVDYRTINFGSDSGITEPGRGLDLGAVGKGYAADRVAQLWREMGVTSGLLNLGGNVHCVGAKPDGADWTVGVRDPEDQSALLCTVSGRDMAVVTSGAYQRNFEIDGVTYHHILDPETCEPAHSGLASVTIVADSGFLADGLSTAVYVMGLDKGTAFWRERKDFDMIVYTDAGELYITSGLEGRVEPAEGLELRVLDA